MRPTQARRMRLSVRALTSAALALLLAPPLVAAIQARVELMVPRAMAGLLAFGAARLLVDGMTRGTQTLARQHEQRARLPRGRNPGG